MIVFAPLLMMTCTLLCALLGMAFYTLFERKFLAHVQWRQGPNKVGWTGFPQPMADALKLFFKAQPYPTAAHQITFFLGPVLGLFLSLALWSHLPYLFSVYWLPYGAISFLALSSLSVYPLLMAGWASNSKYALLGAMRGIAQTISYEISMALLLISIFLLLQSLNFSSVVSHQWSWNTILCPPLAVAWFITILAETNRTPFDYVEGESELVSGFNVEFSGGGFTLLFMGEYVNILIHSALTTVMLISPVFPVWAASLVVSLVSVSVASLFVGVRASLPRLRYDRLMNLTWTIFLPASLFLLYFLLVFLGTFF